jgi:CheY-like chemotaxis protein
MYTIPSKQLKNNQLKEESHMKTDHIVFLAEDDLDDEEMLVEMIREQYAEMKFITANTGSKALEMFKSLSPGELPCLIVLDYNLPEMSGAEILAKLKEMKRYDKVIKVVWSTSNSPVYQKKCLELGAHSYIVKPTGISGIKAIAKELVSLCVKTVA